MNGSLEDCSGFEKQLQFLSCNIKILINLNIFRNTNCVIMFML